MPRPIPNSLVGYANFAVLDLDFRELAEVTIATKEPAIGPIEGLQSPIELLGCS